VLNAVPSFLQLLHLHLLKSYLLRLLRLLLLLWLRLLNHKVVLMLAGLRLSRSSGDIGNLRSADSAGGSQLIVLLLRLSLLLLLLLLACRWWLWAGSACTWVV